MHLQHINTIQALKELDKTLSLLVGLDSCYVKIR